MKNRHCVLYFITWIGIILISVFVYLFSSHVHTISDKWVGFIGSMIGGGLTVTGVIMTLNYQSRQESEQHRLENLPLLSFKIDGKEASNDDADETVTIMNDRKLSTSSFINEGLDETGVYFRDKITHLMHITANHPTFCLIVDEVSMNGKRVEKDASFAPMAVRVDDKTEFRLQINAEYFDHLSAGNEVITDSFWLIRFSYEDIFGNKYCQDLPIIYEENEPGETGTEQFIKIRDLRAPTLYKDRRSIEETSKEYQDSSYM